MDKINLEGKKVLVTGGSGYLGKLFIKRLIEFNAVVFSFDINSNFINSDISAYQVDLKNQNLLNKLILEIQPTIIYHLAASLNRTRDFNDANSLIDTNLTGTINLLNALKEVPYENFILISTSEVYGGSSIKAPFKEDDNFVPASPYSLSKYCAENALKTYSNIYAKNFTILRLFNFFGKDMPKTFLLPQLIDKLEQNKDFNMTKGDQKRDFIYVEDVLDALILACSVRAYNHTFNVCSGVGRSIKELVIDFQKLLNSTSNINFGAIPYRNNEVWDMTGQNSKIKMILGWQPKFTVFEEYLNKNDKN